MGMGFLLCFFLFYAGIAGGLLFSGELGEHKHFWLFFLGAALLTLPAAVLCLEGIERLRAVTAMGDHLAMLYPIVFPVLFAPMILFALRRCSARMRACSAVDCGLALFFASSLAPLGLLAVMCSRA
jgi:uncharacterized membrane protein